MRYERLGMRQIREMAHPENHLVCAPRSRRQEKPSDNDQSEERTRGGLENGMGTPFRRIFRNVTSTT